MDDIKQADRFLLRDDAEAIGRKIKSFARGGGQVTVAIENSWSANVRWSRNRIISSGDTRETLVQIGRSIRGAGAVTLSNEIDDQSLREAVRRTEALARLNPEGNEFRLPDLPPEEHLEPDLWSDTTYNLSPEEQADIAARAISKARKEKVLAAGFVKVGAYGQVHISHTGKLLYYPHTLAQLSLTVRDAANSASGWAGTDHTRWEKIDHDQLIETAVEKCLASKNSRRLEPGRYTVVLEPQAVADFFNPLFNSTVMDRRMAEMRNSRTPFSRGDGNSKIGEKVFDERITITSDPTDPDLGYPPFDRSGNGYYPAVWVKNGVLVNLAYDRYYAIQHLGSNSGLMNPGSYKMHGTNASIQELISGTRRGLLITRFSNVVITDSVSMMMTGYTRDGIWLISQGRIEHPIRNFRFTESPIIALNNVEMVGAEARVFNQYAPVVAPSLRIRDFSMVAITNAI